MIHLLLPEGTSTRRLPFYLSMEEWAATHLPPAEYFFTWTVPPTVICGRNQLMEAEIDMEYCRRAEIDVCRRKSGGGAVYADKDNIMVSYVSAAAGTVEEVFAHHSHRLAEALRALGLDAHTSGRNDVLIGDRKVSGGAFLQLPGRSIVHSTLLFSTDMGNMARAITPARAKLESKQVQSVESRITTVAEHLPGLSIEELRSHLIRFCTSQTLALTPQQVQEIEATERATYGSLSERGGGVYDFKQPRRRAEKTQAIYMPGLGTLNVGIALSPTGIIEAATLGGDLMGEADLAAIEQALTGLHCSQIGAAAPPRLAEAIAKCDNIQSYIKCDHGRNEKNLPA